MTETMVDAVFFDLDGTLVDSLPVMYQVYHHFLAAYNHQGHMGEFQELNGPSIPEVVSILKSRYALAPPVETLLRQYQRFIQEAYDEHCIPQPGATEVLDYLTQKGIPVALVTSASQTLAQSVVKRFEWQDYFRHLITPEGLPASKPHPAIYLKAIATLGVTAQGCYAVEDSGAGVQSATEARLSVFWYRPNGGQTTPEHEKIIPITDLSQLRDFF